MMLGAGEASRPLMLAGDDYVPDSRAQVARTSLSAAPFAEIIRPLVGYQSSFQFHSLWPSFQYEQ